MTAVAQRAGVGSTLVLVLLVGAGCHPDRSALRRAVAEAEEQGAETYAPVPLATAREALMRLEEDDDPGDRTMLIEQGLIAARTAKARAVVLSRKAEQRGAEQRQKHAKGRAIVAQQQQDALQAAAANRAALPLALPPKVGRLEPRAVQARLEKGENLMLVDVRSARAFTAGHITGALSAPAASLQHRRLPDQIDVVLYADDLSTGELNQAAQLLSARGYTRLAVIGGGFDLWKIQGLPWVSTGGGAGGVGLIEVDALAVARADKTSLVLLDLREPAAFASGHLPGARNLSVTRLPEGVPEAGRDIVIYGADDVSAARAARRIAEILGQNVRYLHGGVRAWVKAGHRLERGAADTDEIE